MMNISDKYKFYLIVGLETIVLPFLVMLNYLKYNFGHYKKEQFTPRKRMPVVDKSISVNIHEWGGYPSIRKKKIKNIPEFECGLKYQLMRFCNYTGQHKLDISVTLSDSEMLSYQLTHPKVIHVPNDGMDFSGYANLYNRIKDGHNKYVLLTNSSVNSVQDNFIDDYISYMESNPTVGLLGTSFNSRIYQTFIYNNFTPHLQSFFLLTTLDVLKELVLKNGSFPGEGITNKLLLIRAGEVRFSTLIMALGYDLACVLEDGSVFKFNKSFKKDNGRKSWDQLKGDYRIYVEKANRINPINKVV